ncbi:MAG: hypothetical protein ACO3U0_10765 [Ilumatobacteraceae bacterium]
MTALAARRREITRRGGALAAVLGVVAVVFTLVGVSTLAGSTIGTTVDAGGPPVRELPFTATALWGVSSGSDLTAAALLVAGPDGTGGTVVVVEPHADVGGGGGAPLRTLRDAFADGGAAQLAGEAEAMLGVALDVVEVMSVDDVAGAVVPATVDGDAVAALGASTGVVAADLEAATQRVAAWQVVASVLQQRDPSTVSERTGRGAADDANGDEVSTPVDIASRAPSSLADMLDLMSGDAVTVFELPVVRDESPLAGGTVAHHDAVLTLLTMSQLAPARVATPLESATVRVVVPFDDGDTASAGRTVSRVAADTIAALRYVGVNVVSVVSGASAIDEVGEPSTATQVWLPDSDRHESAASAFGELFGDVEAIEGDYRVPGVDVVIVLGESYLVKLAASGGQ